MWRAEIWSAVPALDGLAGVAGSDDEPGTAHPERPDRLARDQDADQQRPHRFGTHQDARAGC
jgi:hypothetical protein